MAKDNLQNFKLTIEYDGSSFHGWQRQANEPTIQATIEKAINHITGTPAGLTASGRTDAGVHAIGQIANFRSNTRIPPQNLGRALNSILPKAIVVKDVRIVDDMFHSRYDALSKVYHYHILNRPMRPAIGRHYAWHIRSRLDLTAMVSALPYLMGMRDFKAFEASGSPRQSTIRHVMRIGFRKAKGYRLVFYIEASGFLRYMVRNIMGTLVEVGLGKLKPFEMEHIIQSQDRSNAGITAPAQGLFLIRVKY